MSRMPVRCPRPEGRGRMHLPSCRRAARGSFLAALVLFWIAIAGYAPAGEEKLENGFRIKYISGDAVYLEGGSAAGLKEGQKLAVRHPGAAGGDGHEAAIAEIELESVAAVSSVGRVLSAFAPVLPGDRAWLSSQDAATIKASKAAAEIGLYPQVVSFTEGDPPDQEVRENLPKPPSPAVNLIRGRIGIDYSRLQESAGGIGSSQFGYVIRIDATRLLGSHWTLSGFHRGRVFSRGAGPQRETLTDLINRTYHLSLTYSNPNSRWAAGVGRLYVPWATSLSTIDGFYFGRRQGRTTIGAFGGTTPDPTSWNYNRDRLMGGGFVNFAGGSFESFHYSSTSGVAVARINWHPERQFGFFENMISYKQYISIYSDQEFDYRTGAQDAGQGSVVLSRSYVTVGLQPHPVIRFDISEHYFRNLPTFDPRLIGTGLLDPYLFQGLSGGFRLRLPLRLELYSSGGRSSRTGDNGSSWNYMGGFAARDILHSGMRADVRYSKFDSSFGSGAYRSLSISRDVGNAFRFDLTAGQQDTISSLTSQTRAHYLNGSADWILGRNYILGFGLTVYRGQVEAYNQYYVSLGYRFDSRRRLEREVR